MCGKNGVECGWTMLNHILGSGRVAASRVRAEHLHFGVEGISSCRVEKLAMCQNSGSLVNIEIC